METNPIPSTCWACDAPATRIADSTECADCGAFQTDAPTCECGRPAVNEVWNGMHNMPVCGACWQEPDTIATEVLVVAAEAGWPPHSVTDAFRDAMARRGRSDSDPLLVIHIARRWAEWY
ncbi:MAG TPA: hypothetical protein VMW08_11865 [Acidimicrobiales bacterium]|nr:hypothetical protein [Acidimicrobiales bacterium]